MYEIRRFTHVVQTGLIVPVPDTTPPEATATWNSADEDGEMTFSGGDLIVTGTGANQWRNCRIITGQTSGLFYAEFRFTNYSTAGWAFFGIGSAYPPGNIGVDANSVGINGDGDVFLNGVSIEPASNPFAINDWVAMAVNITADKLWYKNITTAGTWNANGEDPTNSSTGIDISGLTGTPFKAMATIGFIAGDVCEANFGATAYQASMPSGYSNWPL